MRGLVLAGCLLLATGGAALADGSTTPHVGMKARFATANTSHDGHLTAQQARDGKMMNVARHFDEIDADHKGYITIDDLRAYHKRVATARKQAQGSTSPDSQDADPQQ